MRRGRAGLVAVLAALAAALVTDASARADVVWLCKPGVEPNPCVGSLRTTIRSHGAPDRVEDPVAAADRAVDCFYVYPTVSGQPGRNADESKDAELFAVARQHAQRFSPNCRVFAPVYRQRTLLALVGAPAIPVEQQAAAFRIAYADVREAWKEYLTRDNAGRGFVLLGHSQGSMMLRQLIHDEIDPSPALRSRLVSAVIPGANVLVRKGQRAGGDFADVPACTTAAQLGCVAAWSVFADPPPDDTRFGRSPATRRPGSELPFGANYEVLCTNPASLAANARAELGSIYRPELFPGLLGVLTLRVFNLNPPLASTPWVTPADRYTGRCERANDANVLMLQSVAGAQKLSPSPDATWGLHLIDVNVVLGDAVELVERQIAAYAAATAALRLRLDYARGPGACARSGVRVTVTGAGAASVRRISVRVGARQVAVDRRAPFRAKVGLRHFRRRALNRISVTAQRADGTRARLTRSLRAC